MKSFARRIPLALGALFLLGCDPKPTTGAIVVNVSGLPSGAEASVRVSGPGDFDVEVPATATLDRLPPGEYTVSINAVTHANGYFTSPLSQQVVMVTAGQTESATVTYALTGGAIELSISGLPTGIAPQVRLLGPGGFSRMVLASGVQPGLPAGTYTIRADTLASADGERFGATHLQTVVVPASLSPATASIAYGIVSGTLSVVIQGLPSTPSTNPVTITGPGGFQRTTNVSATYRGLDAGTYTIAAAITGNCPSVYTPAQHTQQVALTGGGTTTGTVTYGPGSTDPATLNLRVDGAYIVQVTQDYAGTVPMIADKKALLRVFANANQCNSVTPKVRVTLGDGTVYDNLTLGAGENSTRLTAEQGILAASYNVELPADKVKQGLKYFVEIDYDNQVSETNEGDNRFPAASEREVTVKAMSPTGLRFVPVTFSANNATGNISGSARVDSFMVDSRRMLPVHSFDVDVRAPYTTTKPALQSNDQNGSWGGVLNELAALQASESNRYYYGVLKVNYSQGVAGIGFIGGKAAMGWDFLPSASPIMAHELGHNFKAFHTPCGGPGGVDPQYPSGGAYAGGAIGTFGYDFTDNTVKSPSQYTDLMGYCDVQWMSDYSYVTMLNHLTQPGTGPTLPVVASASPEPGLLVWGRIINGKPVLEPAFEVTARTQIPATGAHRLTAVGSDGREVFSVSFNASRIADLPGEQESFAMVLPQSMLRGRTLASLRLTARGGQTATSVQAGDLTAASGISMSRVRRGAMRVRWDAARYPVVMVRNPRTGDILSFARGGDVTIATDADELELNYSNRVRSIRELRRAQ